MLMFFFFFCKQKTAYEMRISDWSSDVCSSDLGFCVTDSDRTVLGKVTSTSHDPELLRRLLRAKDRMDAASHEAWPVQRLARVSHVSAAHFARAFKDAFGVPPHR